MPSLNLDDVAYEDITFIIGGQTYVCKRITVKMQQHLEKLEKEMNEANRKGNASVDFLVEQVAYVCTCPRQVLEEMDTASLRELSSWIATQYIAGKKKDVSKS